MKTPRPQFSRRDLLKAAGSTLAVPLFLRNAFGAETPATAPPSLVLLHTTNGTHPSAFWPATGTFDSEILHRLLSDPVLGPKATLIQGINYHAIGTPSGNEHDKGFHGLYSGFDSIAGPGGSFGGGISLDQRIANMDALRSTIAAWSASRTCGKVVWRFTTEDARIKLHRLYPSTQ